MSLLFAFIGLLPTGVPSVIYPKNMLEKGINSNEKCFRIAVIEKRDETIKSLEKLSKRKASLLKHSLIFLGLATIFTLVQSLL